jgi:putative hydrolase of the HAD superfamily
MPESDSPASSPSTLRTPKFIYFDLGNVLLFFSHERMCRQMGALLGADWQPVYKFLFDGDNHRELAYESGEYDARALYGMLCREFRSEPDYDRLVQAAGDIFWPNVSLFPLLAHLKDAGYKLGILSNINDMHWQFICQRGYGLIPGIFDKVVLSYEARAVKPQPKIFEYAAKLAGVRPEEIFYTDDIAGHIAGARQAGFDAVQFTSVPVLADALRARGVKSNF